MVPRNRAFALGIAAGIRSKTPELEAAIRRLLEFMPYSVVENSDDCPDDKPVAVVNDADGEVMGCHADREAAEAQIAELDAEDEDDAVSTSVETFEATPGGAPFTAVVCVEGMDTGDGRYLEVDGGTWRPLPMPSKSMFEDSMMGGHGGSVLSGRVDTITREGRRLVARGFLTDDESGARTEDLIRKRVLRGVSIDIGEADVEPEVVAVDEEGWPMEIRARFTTYEIGAVTFCAMQALKLAVVWLDDMDPPDEYTMDLPEPVPPVDEPEVIESGDSGGVVILASGLNDDELAAMPPASFFDEPEMDGPTPVTISEPDEHGWRRIFGHLALWGECHIGIPGVCVTAPPSPSDYAYFRTGLTRARCDCGDEGHDAIVEIPTGLLTTGPGHADKPLSAAAAAWHYEHNCAGFACAVAGENEWGIWFSGAIPPSVTDDDLRTIRAQKPSGDWRGIGGHLELVAALWVNTPGFPVPRTGVHVTASGQQTALVAAASPIIPPDEPVSRAEFSKLLARFAELEGTALSTKRVTDLFTDDAAERLAARLRS